MRRPTTGRVRWFLLSRAQAIYWRSVGWHGCPNWSHNLTWREA